MRLVMSTDHPRRLFRRRLQDYVIKQYRNIRAVIDLIVLLYIFVPGLLLGGWLYIGLWDEGLPRELESFPYSIWPALLYFLVRIMAGGLVLFVEDADVLFLRRGGWLQAVMIRSMVFSALTLLLAGALGLGLLAPVLVRIYGLGIEDIWVLMLGTVMLLWMEQLTIHLIQVKRSGVRRFVLRYGTQTGFIAAYVALAQAGRLSPAWLLGGAAAAFLASMILMRYRLRLQGTFDADVREDARQKERLTAFLLSSAVDKPSRTAARPWIFRHSNRLLKSGDAAVRFAELGAKSFYRSWVYLRLYVLYSVLGAVLLQLPPYPANLLVYAGLVLLLAYWMNSYRLLFIQRSFMKMLPLDEQLPFRAGAPFMFLLMLPGVVLLTLGVGLSLFHAWWGAVLGLAAGIFITWWISSWIWKVFGGWKGRRLKLK
ncbi:ABC transporter permease [Paenibacillus sp. CAA11]|uniref:ABC transporter permease n=1 Tax=Paenibacillus sp. CAA11 TaxID=1532905 RepID=UPI001F3E85AF|nr:ABC transporter permease [Paenibacillus sp. CAA11]